MAISARKYGPLKKMSDAYDWADDAARCYALAIKTLREQYLFEGLPGETAAQWLARKKSRRILEKSCQNPGFSPHFRLKLSN